MIISMMLFEFQYSAMVERKLAYNELDQLRALYLAKSGAHIGLLRVALYGRAQASPDLKRMSAGVPLGPYLELIWNLPLPAFPPTKDKNKLEKLLKEDQDAAEKMASETRVSEGTSTHVITSESSKINLNYLVIPPALANTTIDLRGPPAGLFGYVGNLLVTLIENFSKESDEAYEQFGNLDVEDLVYNIMDWVNPGQTGVHGGNKDAYYEGLNPPYKAKKSRFFTLDELKLVKGIDDVLYEKIKPYVTVYSYDGKVNLNSAGKDIYKALYKDFSDDDIRRILEERDKLGGWTQEADFVTYVTNTLGRTAFKTIYSDPNNYPFSVLSQSFLIEAMGSIQKSKTQVQKIIRVAVAFKSGGGAVLDKNIANKPACDGAGKCWVPIQNACYSKPTNADECITLGGTLIPGSGGQYCNNGNGGVNCGPIAVAGVSGTVPAATPTATTPSPSGAPAGAAATPNAMKILSWTES